MKIMGNNPHGLTLLSAKSLEFHALGPVNYKAAGLLTYAVSDEFAKRALNNPDVVGIVTTGEIAERGLVAFCNRYNFDGWIASDDPQADFFRFHNWLADEMGFYDSYISTCWAGAEPHIYPDNVVIEDCTAIHPGAIIGYPGYRRIHAKNGEYISVVHAGGVHICEGAHIGANAVVVKSVWPRPTRIGKNAFVGNLVNVGHNAQVGDNAVILSGAILGGSCVIGDGATVDIGAIIRPQIKVGAGAYVSMGSVVTQDVPDGERVTGNFAVEHERFIRRVKGWDES